MSESGKPSAGAASPPPAPITARANDDMNGGARFPSSTLMAREDGGTQAPGQEGADLASAGSIASNTTTGAIAEADVKKGAPGISQAATTIVRYVFAAAIAGRAAAEAHKSLKALKDDPTSGDDSDGDDVWSLREHGIGVPDLSTCLRAAAAFLELAEMPADIIFSNAEGLRAEYRKRAADILEHAHVGASLLHVAAFAGNVDEMRSLIEAGADVNAEAGNGATPLYFAARNDHKEAILLLLDTRTLR